MRNLLVKDWRKVLLTHWSMWLVYASLLCDWTPYIVPYLDNYIPSWLSVALLVLAPLAKVLKQGKDDNADQ